MTPKLFAGLMLGAGASLLLAGLAGVSQGRWSTGKVAGEMAVPALSSRLNEVATIKLQQGETTLTLERKDALWSVKERGGYPAKPERARSLLVQLAQAQLAEKKTRNAQKYTLLELDDAKVKDTKSRGLLLLDKAGKPIAEVVLGKKRVDAFGAGKNGVYMRRPNDAQTWLVNGDPDTSLEVKDWVDRGVFETDGARVARVRVEHPGGETLTIARMDGKEGAFALAELTDGQKLKAGTSLDSVTRAFTSIELDDVRKTVAPPPPADQTSSATLETLDGLTVTFRLRKEAADSWVTVAASGKDKAAEAAATLAKRLDGWEFKVPAWKADALFKRKADLLETS